VVSLVFGLLFAAIAAGWVVSYYFVDLRLNIPNLGLLMAGALILIGLLGVVGSLRNGRGAATVVDTQVPANATNAANADDTETAADTTAAADTDDPDEAEDPPGRLTETR